MRSSKPSNIKRLLQRLADLWLWKGLSENQKRPLGWLFFAVLALGVVWASQPYLWPGGLGFGKDKSVTVTSLERDKQGNITKSIETTKNDDGKTLWDLLSLLGVPLSLAVLGYWLQQIQQKRTEEVTREQRDLAAEETREEVLQGYFDRLSVLLVDKNLLAIATKIKAIETQEPVGLQLVTVTTEERELLDSAVDIIRARTLSILRRFQKDSARKTSVIWFLIEADIISKLRLSLRSADLSGANVFGANLSGTNLSDSNLSGTDLFGANLFGADLSRADLSRADLSRADLSGAQLGGAQLSGASLFGANLFGANLFGADLSRANLSRANLSGTNLSRAILLAVDLQQAKAITQDQLKENHPPFLCNVALPEGFKDKDEFKDRDCDRLPQELLKREPLLFKNLEEAKQYVDELRQKKRDLTIDKID